MKKFSPSIESAIAIEEKIAKDFRPKNKNELPHEYERLVYKAKRAHWNAESPPVYLVKDLSITAVGCRYYYPSAESQNSGNLIIYIHGGGWVVGDLDTHDRICRLLALKSGYAVLAIDYALAPEAKLPVQVMQIMGIYRTLVPHNKKIIIAGDSAGANLAMALSNFCTKIMMPEPHGLILFYGAFGLQDSPSHRLYGQDEYYGLTKDAMRYYSQAYFGPESSEEIAEEPLFNVLIGNLRRTPPTHIVACDLDPLRDDSRALYEKLKLLGRAVHYQEFTGVCHGFLHYSAHDDQAMMALDDAAHFAQNLISAHDGQSMYELVHNAFAQIHHLTPEQAITAIAENHYQLIDLRDIRELEREGKIESAFHMPRSMLEFWIDPQSPYYKPIFTPEKKYLLFCAGGWRSALAAQTMQNMGYHQVAHISGGYSAYRKALAQSPDPN